jgi:integrase
MSNEPHPITNDPLPSSAAKPLRVPQAVTSQPAAAGPQSPQNPRRRKAKKGWYAIQRPSGNWSGYAWDPKVLKYKSDTWPTEREALEWAERENAKLKLGQAKAGRVALETLRDEYVKAHPSVVEAHKRQFQFVVNAAIAAGITDLNDEDRVVEKTRDFLANLCWKGIAGKPATDGIRRDYLKHLRALAHFAMKEGKLVTNPFKRIDKPPKVSSLKAVFMPDDLGKLVHPRMQDHPFYLPMMGSIYCGFRPGEVRAMCWEWFLWDDMRIAMPLPGKGSKEKRSRITRLMVEFFEIMKPRAQVRGRCFPEYAHISNGLWQARFNSYCAVAGVEIMSPLWSKPRTPYSFRHTWTCLMLASGEESGLVQTYQGHSTQEMQRYYAKQQDMFRHRVGKSGWERGELRLRDFTKIAEVAANVS